MNDSGLATDCSFREVVLVGCRGARATARRAPPEANATESP